MEAPANLPDIFTVLNVMISCGLFVVLLAYFIYRQFTVTSLSVSSSPKTKTQ
jgi:alpha-1,3-glucosyltransferase